jgi:hypothetical protein
MSANPTDHAGLEVLPFDECVRLLATVPVGRVGFLADGEVVILPVNHVVDGHDIIFRTDTGTKLSVLGEKSPTGFEADSYDERTRSGWSVVLTGRTEVVDDDDEIMRLGGLGLRSWGGAEHPYWIRLRPASVTGRRTARDYEMGSLNRRALSRLER